MFALKKVLLAVGTAALCLSIGSAAWAVPSILVTDLTDGGPTAVAPGVDVDPATIIVGPESGSFDAILHIPNGQGVLNLDSGPSLFVLTEPGGGVTATG